MYGLTHRIANDTPADRDVVEPSPLDRISSLGARATVMVIDRDPLTLAMVRRAVADHYHVVVARDPEEALGLVNDMKPDVLIFDIGLDEAEVAILTVALAACDVLDATPRHGRPRRAHEHHHAAEPHRRCHPREPPCVPRRRPATPTRSLTDSRRVAPPASPAYPVSL